MNPMGKMKFKSMVKKLAAMAEARKQGGDDEAVLQKEIDMLIDLAKFYDKHVYDKDVHSADTLAIESYRAAAELGDANAQYITAKRMIEKGRFWVKVAASPHSFDVHQQYAQSLFTEGFGYLEKAEAQKHPIALRLHGLVCIHGWGVEPDQNKGFQYIVDSIDAENAWDKATEIFAELKLNGPEFFSSIMSLKAQKDAKEE